MRTCIYCRKPKNENRFTLEHVIPQFLGGAYAPDFLKTRNVCSDCNSNLGLFVDAGFEKDFFVFNELSMAARSLFNPKKPTGLPFQNMGNTNLTPPGIEKDEVCELWLGQLGEQVYWIRPSDARMYWYTGGNPRTAKTLETRAYFICSIRTQKAPIITWLSFKEAFSGRKVRKISCSRVEGANLADIGFSIPDVLDSQRVEYFKTHCMSDQPQECNISMYTRFDVRFMAKLAVGLGHVLLGEKFDTSDYRQNLYEALWLKDNDPVPQIYGQSNLDQPNSFVKDQLGVSNGVTLTILPYRQHMALNLNISRKMNWIIGLENVGDGGDHLGLRLNDGFCIIMFKPLRVGLTLSMSELIAHNNSETGTNPELTRIEGLSGQSKDYFKKIISNIPPPR